MKQHLLLEKAFIYPINEEVTELNNYVYNSVKGYWVHLETSEALILDSNLQKPKSKKCDRETGEDQKGE